MFRELRFVHVVHMHVNVVPMELIVTILLPVSVALVELATDQFMCIRKPLGRIRICLSEVLTHLFLLSQFLLLLLIISL